MLTTFPHYRQSTFNNGFFFHSISLESLAVAKAPEGIRDKLGLGFPPHVMKNPLVQKFTLLKLHCISLISNIS